jgi:hypothetical protein
MSRMFSKGLLTGLVVAVLLMAGCSTTGTANGGAGVTPIQQTFINTCNGYAATLSTLAGYAQSHLLTPSAVSGVNSVRSVVNPICLGPMPSDPTSALATLQGQLPALLAVVSSITGGK